MNAPLRFGLALAFAAAVLLAGVRADDKDDVKKQIQELNDIKGTDLIRPKAIELLKNKDKAKKLLKAADDMAKLDSKQFKYNGAYVLALIAHQLKDFDVATRFYRLCDKQAREMKSATKIVEAFEGEYGILYETKRFEDAEQLCQRIMETENDELEKMKPFIMEYLIQVKTRQGKVDDALKLCDLLVKADDGGWYFMRLKAWVLHEAGRNEESAKAYNESIDRLEKNESLKPEEQERWIDRTRYVLSNVYVELGQVDKAAGELKALLKKKPDNSTYNNDLGYIWADHDQNLDEAEKMIRKALDEDRKERKKNKDLLPEDDHDNAAYLDSLGWVLFKKKQFAEAKKPLLEAVKDKEGMHVEILDHLADVQMALGEKAEAIKTWKLALDQDASTKRDLKRRGEVAAKLKAAEGKK